MKKEYELELPSAGKKPVLPGKILSPEILLRLNPHWIVESYEEIGQSFTANIKDHASEERFELTGALAQTDVQAITLILNGTDCSELSIFPKDGVFWAKATFAVDDELDEDIERMTVLWIRSIKEYLRMYLKNTVQARFFRYIMNKVIIKMTPSQRKISLMLIRITIVEILVIILIVIGYVVFVLKPS